MLCTNIRGCSIELGISFFDTIASFCHLLATAHAAAGNAALATPLQPSTALGTATVPPVPATPGKSHLSGYCFIKDYIST